jgi:hypothetical protein
VFRSKGGNEDLNLNEEEKHDVSIYQQWKTMENNGKQWKTIDNNTPLTWLASTL